MERLGDDYLLFFIELESRRVWIGGITRHPESYWMQQVARNATLEDEGYLKGRRDVLHARGWWREGWSFRREART